MYLKKEKVVIFRIDNELDLKLKEESKKLNLSKSKYITKILLGRKFKVIEGGNKILIELKRIGNNVNQLTKLSNSKIIQTVALNSTKERLDKIWQLLNALVSKKEI